MLRAATGTVHWDSSQLTGTPWHAGVTVIKFPISSGTYTASALSSDAIDFPDRDERAPCPAPRQYAHTVFPWQFFAGGCRCCFGTLQDYSRVAVTRFASLTLKMVEVLEG